jgi:hypothetical protein
MAPPSRTPRARKAAPSCPVCRAAGVRVGDDYPVRILAAINVSRSPSTFVSRLRQARLASAAEQMITAGAICRLVPCRRRCIASRLRDEERCVVAAPRLREVAQVLIRGCSAAASLRRSGRRCGINDGGPADDPDMARVACDAGG